MPMINFHACRLVPPSKFQKDSFRTMKIKRKKDGKHIVLIVGKLKGDDVMSLQAFRYPKTEWSSKQAKAHCKKHKGILFEAAKDKKLRAVLMLLKSVLVGSASQDRCQGFLE